jgi:molecular chaperone GrpE
MSDANRDAAGAPAAGPNAEEVVGAEASVPTTDGGGAVPEEVSTDAAATPSDEDLEAEQEAVAEQEPRSEQPVEQEGAQQRAGHPDTALAAERLVDLQRLQAEYVNYKRRVDRDRAVVQERAVHSVIEALLPVLDDINAARDHGELAGGPFAAIADKLEATLSRFGLERYGEPGEPFDPVRHEALMHTQADLPPGTEVTTVVQVLQPGYRAGEQVIRAARVAVADPQ